MKKISEGYWDMSVKSEEKISVDFGYTDGLYGNIKQFDIVTHNNKKEFYSSRSIEKLENYSKISKLLKSKKSGYWSCNKIGDGFVKKIDSKDLEKFKKRENPMLWKFNKNLFQLFLIWNKSFDPNYAALSPDAEDFDKEYEIKYLKLSFNEKNFKKILDFMDEALLNWKKLEK